jgi:RNA polymerase sigma factor, sigma-70 family
MDEIRTIKEAQEGSRAALNKLLTDNYGILKGYLIKITCDSSLAQDITQETMLRAVQNIKRFHEGAKFSTYLITIATNLYRDYIRKNKRIESLPDDLESGIEGPEELSVKGIEYREAVRIIKALPYEKRAVFILKHYYGYSYEEISEILKCPIGTVRSRLHYCIEHIRNEMEKEGFI